LVSLVEGEVARARRAIEKASEGESELDKISSLETTPDEDGRKGDRVTNKMKKD